MTIQRNRADVNALFKEEHDRIAQVGACCGRLWSSLPAAKRHAGCWPWPSCVHSSHPRCLPPAAHPRCPHHPLRRSWWRRSWCGPRRRSRLSSSSARWSRARCGWAGRQRCGGRTCSTAGAALGGAMHLGAPRLSWLCLCPLPVSPCPQSIVCPPSCGTNLHRYSTGEERDLCLQADQDGDAHVPVVQRCGCGTRQEGRGLLTGQRAPTGTSRRLATRTRPPTPPPPPPPSPSPLSTCPAPQPTACRRAARSWARSSACGAAARMGGRRQRAPTATRRCPRLPTRRSCLPRFVGRQPVAAACVVA